MWLIGRYDNEDHFWITDLSVIAVVIRLRPMLTKKHLEAIYWNITPWLRYSTITLQSYDKK